MHLRPLRLTPFFLLSASALSCNAPRHEYREEDARGGDSDVEQPAEAGGKRDAAPAHDASRPDAGSADAASNEPDAADATAVPDAADGADAATGEEGMDASHDASVGLDASPQADAQCGTVEGCGASECVPGEYVVSPGQCAACANGTFSDAPNSPACYPWRDCGFASVVIKGSARSDVVCAPGAHTVQLGTRGDDLAYAMARAPGGRFVIAGFTSGSVPGAASAGGLDVWVQLLEPDGSVVWATQVGSSGDEKARAVTIDAAGDVYVTGHTSGALTSDASSGGNDVFVAKLTGLRGSVAWISQFGADGDDMGRAIVCSGSTVYVGGTISDSVAGVGFGLEDALLATLEADTGAVGGDLFGTVGADGIKALALDDEGSVYLAGYTEGQLGAELNAGGLDAFVRKVDASGRVQWTTQWGTTRDDIADALRIAPGGHFFAAGSTLGEFDGFTSEGESDAFVARVEANGSVATKYQFGTSIYDEVGGLAVTPEGDLVVAGSTFGVFPGQTAAGLSDAFFAQLKADGSSFEVLQFGTSYDEYAEAIEVGDGVAYYLGVTAGTLGNASQGAADAFIMQLPLQ